MALRGLLNGLAGNDVDAIAVDSKNYKWFATDMGISKFDDTVWTKYTASDGIGGISIRAVAIDAQDNKWFGIYEGGISKFIDKE